MAAKTTVSQAYLPLNRIENNLDLATYEEAGFVDAEQLNLQLRDDSRVYVDVPGFEKIPFEENGLYADEFRKRVR